jgi:hypothetical protein
LLKEKKKKGLEKTKSQTKIVFISDKHFNHNPTELKKILYFQATNHLPSGTYATNNAGASFFLS